MPRRILLLAIVVAAATTLPAAADWLVTKAGERIETRGPWRIEDGSVTFTRLNGTLSALRLSEVDLEASERATRAARAGLGTAAAARATTEGKPALVLDNEDVARAPRQGAEAAADETEAAAGSGSGRVEVESWEETSEPGDDLTFTGTIRNSTKDYATDLQLRVTVYDETGAPTATRAAQLARSALPPGGSTTFEVQFPGIYITRGTKFDVRHRGFVASDPGDRPAGESETEGDS